MKTLMQYKGYFGSFELDEEDAVFYGKVEHIKALVAFEATTAKGLQKAFRAAVNDYLKTCAVQNIAPEKPLKGSFNVRTGTDLHRKIAIAAAKVGISLNQFVCQALEKAL